MGPSRVESLGGKRYILIVVDDFSRFTWIDLLREKSEMGDLVKSLCKRLKIKQNLHISRVRSDHGKEFDNFNLENFCLEKGIKHEFSSPITPQQNGVVERKNRVLQEMARAMLHGKDLAMHFWGEAINTACHIINRVYLRPKLDKTPYEIWKGKKPTSVLESVNIVIDDDFTEGESAENGVAIEDLGEDQGATAENKEHSIPESPRSSENIFEQGLPNWDQSKPSREPSSRIEPKKVEKAFKDECWVNAMHEELNQFPKGFIDPKFPHYVYKLNKALYGLKQAPRAWYDRLTTYLVEHGFSRGGTNRTLFIRHIEETITVAHIYVDDIIFGYPIDSLALEFVECMKQEFEKSMVGKLSYFLGLQVKQTDCGLFIFQSKYAKDLVKRFSLDSKKHTRTPMSANVKLGHDPTSKSVD
ncbi:uncharacterized protein LOC111388134 [Olea europaea var. sylvestris]|uniref:uncharacterized protein LOC111388134 n=1 Tax=Olea europaea var. sylvestris TaxID=158386 RepID=UPI000C1CD066|nr:uncharacterized protein LOC111388134 [Olea europaea var. sylvestris]